jgi:hypothetical protein
MKTKNDWINGNIAERITDPRSSFNITLNPYPFKKLDFNSAVKLTVNEISNSYSNLYLALSGGYDSEFTLRAFHKMNIPITPIIVCYANKAEREFAYKVCVELQIKYLEIHITDDDYLNYYTENIYKKFNGAGHNATQSGFAAEYVATNGGTLIICNHLIGEYGIISDDEFASSSEWDFYLENIYPDTNIINFFLYTAELAYSMMPEHNGDTWQNYRQKLYNIKYRDKIRPEYSIHVELKLKELHSKRPAFKYKTVDKWSRSEICNIFEKVKI